MRFPRLAASLTAACLMVVPNFADAAFPGISPTKYIKTYILSNENIPVYADAALTIRGTAKPYLEYDSAIYPVDEIRVFEINGDWAYVAYPTTTAGWREGYIPLSAITENNFSRDGLKFKGLLERLYKRTDGSKYNKSSIFDNDTVYTVAKSGDYTQVVYPARTVYKMAWMNNDDYQRGVVDNPVNQTGAANKRGERYNARFAVPYYATNDSRWEGKLGDASESSLFAAVAMKYSFHSKSKTYPDYIKNKMLSDGKINWNVLQDFSYEYLNYHGALEQSTLSRILREIIYGKPVIVGAVAGDTIYWTLVVGYDGELVTPLAARNFIIVDPFDATCTNLEAFMKEKNEIARIIF